MNLDDPNYDGQGKTAKQEADDSATLVAFLLVYFFCLTLIALAGMVWAWH